MTWLHGRARQKRGTPDLFFVSKCFLISSFSPWNLTIVFCLKALLFQDFLDLIFPLLTFKAKAVGSAFRFAGYVKYFFRGAQNQGDSRAEGRLRVAQNRQDGVESGKALTILDVIGFEVGLVGFEKLEKLFSSAAVSTFCWHWDWLTVISAAEPRAESRTDSVSRWSRVRSQLSLSSSTQQRRDGAVNFRLPLRRIYFLSSHLGQRRQGPTVWFLRGTIILYWEADLDGWDWRCIILGGVSQRPKVSHNLLWCAKCYSMNYR